MKLIRWLLTLGPVLAVTAALTLGVSAAETVASGVCGWEGSNVTWSLDADGLLDISGTGEMTDYNRVTGVPWYEHRLSVKKVVIGNGVTSIGKNAFCQCRGLTEVTIPDSVACIGDYAFLLCGSLTEVTVPGGVTDMGYGVFSECSGLRSAGPIGGGYNIEFGWTESIPDRAFHSCGSLEEVAFPDSVTKIGMYAFDSCERLTEMTVPDSVIRIENYAFFRCTGLTKVTIPKSTASVGYSLFGGCGGLKSAGPIGGGYDIEFGWTEQIPDYVFYGCGGLTDVTIPEGVTSVGTGAFSRCGVLTEVTVPASVVRIGNAAFQECTSLTDLYYSGGKRRWGTVSGSHQIDPETVAIHYAVDSYTVSYDPGGGTGTKASELADSGDPFTLPEAGTFAPPADRTFKAWSINSAEYAPGDMYIATGDVTVTALWRDLEIFTVTASAGEHGSISPSGEIPVNEGGAGSFEIIPDEGYLASVTIDGVPVLLNGVLIEGALADTDSLTYYGQAKDNIRSGTAYLALNRIQSDRTVSAEFTAPYTVPEEPVTAVLSLDGKNVEFSAPAGMLEEGTQVLAARYEDGRLLECAGAAIPAGERIAVFSKVLDKNWSFFLLNPKTCAPLCSRVDAEPMRGASGGSLFLSRKSDQKEL